MIKNLPTKDLVERNTIKEYNYFMRIGGREFEVTFVTDAEKGLAVRAKSLRIDNRNIPDPAITDEEKLSPPPVDWRLMVAKITDHYFQTNGTTRTLLDKIHKKKLDHPQVIPMGEYQSLLNNQYAKNRLRLEQYYKTKRENKVFTRLMNHIWDQKRINNQRSSKLTIDNVKCYWIDD